MTDLQEEKSRNWTAISSVVIALCALLVSFWTIHSDQKNRRLSVKPLPNISYFHNISDFRIVLDNGGLGPMLVESIQYIHPDGSVSDRMIPKKIFDEGALIRLGDPIFQVKIDDVTAVRSGEKVDLVRYVMSVEKTNYVECLEFLVSGTEIVVGYTDIYGGSPNSFTYQLPQSNTSCP